MARTHLTRRTLAVAASVVMGAALAACSSGSDTAADAGAADAAAGGSITIAHQAFGESEILAHTYGAALEAQNYEVEYQSFKDRAAIYAALESGDVDLVPEYAASATEFLNGNAGEASPDIVGTMAALSAQLEAKGLAAATASNAVDSNSLVVTGETSSAKGLTKISQLTTDLKLGAPQDCPTNAGCIPALQGTYGLDFTDSFVPLDLGGPLTKEALENGDIDVAVIFSTDSTIATKGWVVLEDDKGIFNADNIVPVGTSDLIGAQAATLDAVSAALTTANLTELNRAYDVDKEDAEDIAAGFLAEAGLS